MDSLIFGQSNSSPPHCPSCKLKNENYQWHSIECNCSKSSYEVQQQTLQHRRLKTDTPREKKDAKYYEKRKRNNMAAKKSREAKRRRDNEMALKLFLLEKENVLLKFRLSAVTEELDMIKRTLVFYNTNTVIWQNNAVLPRHFQKK